MKKEVFILFGFIFIILAGAFVFAAESNQLNSISQEVQNYVKGFVEKGGINETSVQSVTEIDKNSLPDDIDIKKIEDNKVGIYQVNYSDQGEQKKVYVITYSAEEFKKQEQPKNVQYLQFGKTLGSASVYLDSASGVESGEDNGYVMMRSGSITGISTSVIISDGNGKLSIRIYKNGEDTGFENLISSQDKKKLDYDLQSEDIVTYAPGDIISVYVEQIGDINWSRMTTMVETIS